MYYGFEHKHGLGMVDEDGEPIGNLVAFPFRAEREEWVSDGPGYAGDPGAREAVSTRTLWVQRLIRRERSKDPSDTTPYVMLIQDWREIDEMRGAWSPDDWRHLDETLSATPGEVTP